MNFYWTLCAWWGCIMALPTLNPHVESFEDRQALQESSFLNVVAGNQNDIIPLTTSIAIQRDRAMMFITKVTPRRFFNNPGDVSLVEVVLGDTDHSVEVKNFPIVTFSAELSSSSAAVEQEITKGYSVSLSFQLQFESKLIQTGFTMGFGSSYALSTTMSQSMVCRTHPGSRAQLQVSTKMMLYPDAKTRNVTFSKNKFINGPWEKVTSTVDEVTVDGALFYLSDYLGLHRCVTDPDCFEDPIQRNWVDIE